MSASPERTARLLYSAMRFTVWLDSRVAVCSGFELQSTYAEVLHSSLFATAQSGNMKFFIDMPMYISKEDNGKTI
jgi:hypothetical protein